MLTEENSWMDGQTDKQIFQTQGRCQFRLFKDLISAIKPSVIGMRVCRLNVADVIYRATTVFFLRVH